MPYYIGIANTCHDPAVAVVAPEGTLVFAEATERYFQKKKAWDLPPDHWGWLLEIIGRYCDPAAGFVVATPWTSPGLMGKVFDIPLARDKFLEKLPQSLGVRDANSFFSASDSQWLLWSQTRSFDNFGPHLAFLLSHYFSCRNVRFRRYDHHLAHAAHACFSSSFKQALCLIADGEGEVGSVSSFSYANGKLDLLNRSWGPGSPGRFYAKVTQLCGFDWRMGEEGKVMGLAAFGSVCDALAKNLGAMMQVKEGQVIQEKEPELSRLLSLVSREHSRQDLAATGQWVFEQKMTELLHALCQKKSSDNLVLGGGCALNSSFNGKVRDLGLFGSVHVPCAPADDGNAVGAALLAFAEDHPMGAMESFPAGWQSAYQGSVMEPDALARLERFFPGAMISRHPGAIHEKAAQILSESGIIGWIQGRAEFGPRALGNRSVLADPRPHDMKDRINRDVKFREGFRPFAPAVLESEAENWFEGVVKSPFMSFTRPWREQVRCRVPAVVHEDGTGRLQTVSRDQNLLFYSLIEEFYNITGVPLVLNTSLNIMGKPIIHTLEDAVGLFFTTGLNALIIEDYLIQKNI